MSTSNSLKEANQKVVKNCIWAAFGMFGFAFLLVPIYNVFCDLTGLNGKMYLDRPTYLGGKNAKGAISNRLVTVEFVVTKNEEMNWLFKPQHTFLTIKPGEIATTGYFAQNLSNHTITAQAIPSITPGKASKYFKKVECFCFSKQTLHAGETQNFGLQFFLDPDLPEDVHRLTLSYTIFDVTKREPIESSHPMAGHNSHT